MVGLSEATTVFRSILWADSELLGIAIDYSDLTLTIRESTGLLRRVICRGYVGYKAVGFWDEIVITKAALEGQGEFLDSCLADLTRRLGRDRPPSGSESRNCESGMQLTLTLGDNCQINVAAKGIGTEILS